MIPENGTVLEFKRALVETTKTCTCYNCGGVSVAWEPDSNGWHWCSSCITPVAAGQPVPGGKARVVNITHWGTHNDSRIRQRMGM
jgi:hypothetical protein